MPLDLLFPNLLPPSDASTGMESLRLPALERWLAAADIVRVAAPSASDWLAKEFGLAVPPPIAPIALVAEGQDARGTWMRADPVHLRLDREAARLHAAPALEIARDEANALVGVLQAHFRGDGLQFAAPSPERWYVRLPDGESPPATAPLASVVGRGVQGRLPESRGGLNWRTALTEAQMLLGAHEVNALREAAGRPAINSLWFWGGGTLPGRVASQYQAIYADDAFARGLGSLSGARLFAMSTTLPDAAPQERTLSLVDAPARALEHADLAAWRDAAERLDAELFATLHASIDRIAPVRVILPGDKETLVATLKRPSFLQRFRSCKAIAAYA